MKTTVENQRMTPARSYGMYYVEGTVNDVQIKVISTNAQAYDWLQDDSIPELHEMAKSYVNFRLTDSYEQRDERAN